MTTMEPQEVKIACERYAARHGRSRYFTRSVTPKLRPVDSVHIAAWYDAEPSRPDDPIVKEAYSLLAAEIERQYQEIVRGGLGVDCTPYDDNDNIGVSSADVFHSLRTRRVLRVYDGGSPHPVLTPLQNWKLRAVHDVLGHYVGLHQFGPLGEHRAFGEHSRLFADGPALLALCTETRCQNSWVNFGPHSHLDPSARPYAEQKATIPPASFLFWF